MRSNSSSLAFEPAPHPLPSNLPAAVHLVGTHGSIPALFLRKSSPKSVFNWIHIGKWSDIW